MDATSRGILWGQFGASLDMLERAIRTCPASLWDDRSRQPEFWYVVFHTLFFLDLYLSDATEGFTPPPPFTLSELDPAGVLPEHPYPKPQLLAYLEHARHKARARIEGLDADTSATLCRYGWIDLTRLESVLYSLRHIHHHVGQLNLMLRQVAGQSSPWIARAR